MTVGMHVALQGALASSDLILRCAAGEALGRLAQVVGGSKFVASVVQGCFDKLKTARDAVSRTGHSLVLGCLHRYVGGLGSGQHIAASVSILHALAQDVSSPVVQVKLQCMFLSVRPTARPRRCPCLLDCL